MREEVNLFKKQSGLRQTLGLGCITHASTRSFSKEALIYGD